MYMRRAMIAVRTGRWLSAGKEFVKDVKPAAGADLQPDLRARLAACDGRFRLPMVVIAAALLGLIALLATLQYRWLGQISGAERERMTATFNARATAYAQDFDRELTRAYLPFQLDRAASTEPTRASRRISPRVTSAGRRRRAIRGW